jgi:(2Fe-2S) ferredoxin
MRKINTNCAQYDAEGTLPGDKGSNMTETTQPQNEAAYYRSHIFCCTNERAAGHPRGCCREKNSPALRDYMKARAKELGLKGVRVNMAGCLDRCELGPVMVIYPQGVWYNYQSEDDIDEILKTHVVDGGQVERLKLDVEQEELRPEQQPA